MEVRMTIDGNQIGETMTELFGKLTLKQKQEMAQEVLQTWLDEGGSIDDEYADKRALEFTREMNSKSGTSRSGYHSNTDSSLRQSDHYKNKMLEYRSSKNGMLSSINKEITEYYKAQVDKLVNTDPDIKRACEQSIQVMKKNFNKLVMQSMTNFFVTNMQQVAKEMSKVEITEAQVRGGDDDAYSRYEPIIGRIEI